MKGFLYGQTEFNMLNNSIHLNDYFDKAVSNSFSFLSITDNNLHGCYKFYIECKKRSLKPIIGLEISYLDDDNKVSKILAYSKNLLGFENLLKISTFLKTNSLPQGLNFLDLYTKDIMFVSVYNESILERYYFSKYYNELDAKLNELNQKFEFYLGYSYTNRLDRLNSNQEFRTYAIERGIKTVPIHNCRYLRNSDTIIYEALTKIGGNSVVISDYEDYSFDSNPICTIELESFVNSINLELFPKKFYLPKYPNTKGLPTRDYLSALCNKGLFKRLNGRINKEYQERLNYELYVIDRMGYNDYFLIVWDFILYAKKKDILIGPGRGSAAGSLVSYCLGITDIDPIKYGLLFERFLNPERISMPDIDTDFPDNYRDEVISYVNELYGPKHVCNISAFNTFQIKSSIRDLGRIMKIDNIRLDEIIKLVSNSKNFDKLLEDFNDRQDIYNFLYIVKGLEGLPRHISTHAAGVIISSIPLDDIIPLQSGINGLYQSQLEAIDLEAIGLLKMDFLGIRNLSIVDEILKQIPNLDSKSLRNIPLNDSNTFKLLQNADTLGIFQLESDGIRKVLSKLKPERFEDLVAVLALYRPGPMDNIDEFIARRHGKNYTYLHPALESILKETYGIIVYQEQIMLIAQKIAGFTLGEADLLRRAVSKKKQDELKRLEEKFITKSLKNGYSIDIATSIYNYILKFANYGFNKSHSVAYGMLSYQMSYLKANYFNIFISKILNNVIGATKTMISYINYAKRYNVQTFKPNINISTNVFEVNKVGMFMPLQSIHSIGESITLEIVEERNKNGLFKDFTDFKRRVNLGESILEALIYSGAFDCFGKSKKNLIESKAGYSEIFSKHLEGEIIDNSEYEFKYLQKKELEYLGFNITYDLFANSQTKYSKYNCSYLNKNTGRSIIVFEKIREITTKKKELMLFGEVKDPTMTLDFVMFSSTYMKFKNIINDNLLYCIEYNKTIDEKNNVSKVIISNLIVVSD